MLHHNILALTEYSRIIYAAPSFDILATNMSFATGLLGYRYYAITDHADARDPRVGAIRVHNYPRAWVEYYDRHHLYAIDPVHRLSHLVNEGFPWSELGSRIDLTAADRAFMKLAEQHGIADGFTVPINIHGEASGSVTFAGRRREMTALTAIMALAIGQAAFACARRLCSPRGQRLHRRATPLTMRQREVTHLVALGKTNIEMAMLMGTSEQTPAKHVKNCFERLEVNKRTLLVSRALFDGTLTFPQILPQLYSPFRE